MTKTDLIALFGTAAAVARFYGITDAAVSAWDADADIPELREMQLEKRRPDLYAQHMRAKSKSSDVFGPAPTAQGQEGEAA